MTNTLDFMASWPIEFIWAITLAALGILALLGWLGHAVLGLGKLRQAIKDTRLELAQLWKKDPLENLRQFKDLAHNGKAGSLSQALEQSILVDSAGRPAAISDPQQSLKPERLIRNAVGRFGSIPALHLMILVGILGTLISALIQLQTDRSQMTLAIAMPGLLSLLMIILYQVVDHLAVHQATRAIEQFQDVLRQHFPVFTESQLQYQLLAAQKQTTSQLKTLAPEITTALSDSLQKQLTPTLRNLNQAFDQAIKHVNDQQQQGMGRLASHFTRQLQQLLGQNLEGLSASVEKLQTLHEASCTHLESLMTVLDRSAGLQSESQAAAQALLTSLAESRQSLAESAAKLDTIHEASAAHLSQIFTDSSAQISQSLTAANENLDLTYRSGADRMNQTFTDSSSLFGQSLAASAAQLVESLSGSSGQLNQIFSDGGSQLSQILAEGAAKLGQTYTDSSTQLSHSLTDGSSQIKQIFADGAGQMNQAYATSSEQLSQTYATASDTLQTTYQTGAETLSKTLADGSSQLNQSLAAGTTNLAESLTGTTSQIQQIFADGGSQLSQIMTDGASQLGQAYTASTDQLNQAYAAASDNLNLSYKSSATQLDSALAASGLAFSQTLASHVDQLNQSLGLSTERLVDSTGHLNTSSDLLNQSLTSLVQELNRVLETSTSQLNEAFTTATQDLNQKYNQGSEEISRTFNTGTEQLNLALANGAEHLTQIYAASKTDLNQAIVAGTEQLAQSMLTSSEQMTQSLVSSSDLLSRNLAANSERFNDSLLSGSEQLGSALIRTSELAASLQTLLAESQESSTRFREDQLQVEQQIGGYFDKMHEQIIRVQDDLQANLVDIFAKFTDLTTTTLVQSDEQYQQMTTKLTEESTQLMNTLDDQVRELSFLVRDVATEISGLNKTLDHSLQQFGDQMQGSTRATFESFDEGLSGIVGQLTDTIRLISDAVDDLPAAVVSARELLIAQSQTGPASADAPSGRS